MENVESGFRRDPRSAMYTVPQLIKCNFWFLVSRTVGKQAKQTAGF